MTTSSRPVSPSAFCIVYRRSSSMGQMEQPKKLGHAGSKGSLLIFTYLHRGFKTLSLQSCSLQMPSSSHFSGLFTCYICTSGIIRSMPSSLLAIFLGTFSGTLQGEKLGSGLGFATIPGIPTANPLSMRKIQYPRPISLRKMMKNHDILDYLF